MIVIAELTEMIKDEVNIELSELGGVDRSGFEANGGGALIYNSYRDTHTHTGQTP